MSAFEEKRNITKKIKQQLLIAFPFMEEDGLLNYVLPYFEDFSIVNDYNTNDEGSCLIYKNDNSYIKIYDSIADDGKTGYYIERKTDENIFKTDYIYNRELKGIYSMEFRKHKNGVVISTCSITYNKDSNKKRSVKYSRYAFSFAALELIFLNEDFQNMDVEEYKHYLSDTIADGLTKAQEPDKLFIATAKYNEFSPVIDNPDIVVKSKNRFFVEIKKYDNKNNIVKTDLSENYNDCKSLDGVLIDLEQRLKEHIVEEKKVIGELDTETYPIVELVSDEEQPIAKKRKIFSIFRKNR